MPEKEDNNVPRAWLRVTTIQAVTTLTVHSLERDIVNSAVSEQQLNGPQILCLTIDQSCFCSSHCMCSIFRGIQADRLNPSMHNSRILPRRDVRRFFLPTWKKVLF